MNVYINVHLHTQTWVWSSAAEHPAWKKVNANLKIKINNNNKKRLFNQKILKVTVINYNAKDEQTRGSKYLQN